MYLTSPKSPASLLRFFTGLSFLCAGFLPLAEGQGVAEDFDELMDRSHALRERLDLLENRANSIMFPRMPSATFFDYSQEKWVSPPNELHPAFEW